MSIPQTQRRALSARSWVCLIPGYVPQHAAMMARLSAELPLRQEHITLFGKTHPTPRLTSWHGDAGCSYRYSGRRFEPSAWSADLQAVRERLVATTGYAFNSVLANLYRNGADAMGAHSDDERDLGPSRQDIGVASVSLGARRRFLLRAKGGGSPIEFALGEGDLLVMGGATQLEFKHWIPRTAKPVGPRMNLTYRVVRLSR